ncbi:MAG TPA: hypothetical protein VJT69_19210 [Pyrinomonadaceae bacterium]|nr:hypothetical protein [Pyrinomonadaceae bacterium]
MNQQAIQPRPTFTEKFNLVAGVILPAIAITVEASTHVSASVFFDPIPTAWHLALVILMPLAQLHVWFTIRRGTPDRLMLAGFANAAVIGISLFYSICYLPFAPVAVLTILIVVGLLPLAPFLSLIAAITMRQQLSRMAATAPRKNFALGTKGLLTGLGVTVVAIGMMELPATLTRYGLQMAASSSAQTRTRGIRFLRTYGSQDQLLKSCYNQTRNTTDILGDLFSTENPVSIDEARKIYYRVTGETFDMSFPPRRVAGRVIPQQVFDYTNDQHGTRIGGKLKGLWLANSKLEGTIDSDGGVGYLEWTLTFQNDSERPKEARAEIQLPPGAVVTRVTQWDEDREIEAVFGNRQKVREEAQVSYIREPVMVTTAGRDRILVQSLVNDELKFRLGITVPLFLESRSSVRLLLPHFEGRNFRIPEIVNHKIWFESARPIATEYGGLYYGQMPDEKFILGGQITDEDLSRPERSLLISRLDRDTGTWSRNPLDPEGSVVKQWIEERTPAHLRRIVLVVDTSASMADLEPEINAALGALPRGIDLKLVLADADELPETEHKDSVGTDLEGISALLATATFTGGADNAPALRKAWDLAAEAPGNNAIVWIHNPQLVQLDSVTELKRRWQSRPYGPLLYSVQTSKGSDEVVQSLDGINEVKSVIRMGTLRADLERLFRQLSGQIKTFEFVRSVKHAELPEDTEGYKTSDSLAKLWANDEVLRLLDAREESSFGTASQLAMRYQLLTSVTDAAIRDGNKRSKIADTAPISYDITSSDRLEFETLFLGAVLLVIALIGMRYRQVGGGSFTVRS